MSGGYDKQIILWNPHQNKLIKAFKGHGYQIMDLAIAHDNGSFVSGGGDKQPFLWDVGTGTVIRKFRGHDQTINAVAFSADSSIAASASYDRSTKLWDCKSRSIDPIQVLEGATDSVTAVTIGQEEIWTVSVDGSLRTYDLRMGQLRTDHTGQPLTSLSISKDERMALLSCLDSKLRIIDLSDGALLAEFGGHHNGEFKLDSIFLHGEAFVASGSEDGKVYTWNIESAQVSSIQAHDRMVSGLSAHPDGGYLLTCSADTTIKMWSIADATKGDDTGATT